MNKQSFERKDPFPGINIKGKSMTRPTPVKSIRQMLGESIRTGIPLQLYNQEGEEVSDEVLEEMYFDPTLDKVEVEILSADVKAEIKKYYTDDPAPADPAPADPAPADPAPADPAPADPAPAD